MIFKRRQIVVFVFTLVLALSSMACFGSTQSTQTPQPPSPTSPPPPTETPIPIATSTVEIATPPVVSTFEIPVSGQVNILEINGFKDEADYWYFYGLVRNDSERTIYDLQIEVNLLDSFGTGVYSYTTNTILYYLAPGETSPFSDFTTEPFPDGETMQATLVAQNSTEAINRANLEYRGITMWVDDYNDIYLAGEVFNGNPDPVEINAIAGSLTDETGKLVTASYAYPFLDYVEPNGSGPFVMMFDAPIGQAGALTNYALYSDALITNPTSTYDISLSDKPNDYQDNNGDMHLVGSATNNNTKPMNLFLVAGAYDENRNCIDANTLYVPIPLNPGETFPYDFIMWGALDYVPAAYEAATQFNINIDWLSTYEASSQAYTLTTEDETHSFDQSIGTFNGIVVNNSGQNLTTAIVIVALYDKTSGELIATSYSFVPESMTKDASGTYEVYLYPPNDIDPANIDIVITALGQ